MSTFHVINLGCKVNKVESDSFTATLQQKGLAVGSLEQANAVLINTCAVTGDAEKKTRKAVRHALTLNQEAPVLVTGCSAALHAEVYEAMSDRVIIAPKHQVVAVLEARCPQLFQAAESQSALDAFAPPVGDGFRKRVGIKVQDGCNNACTYCIVHVARGVPWSRPLPEVLQEAQSCIDAGAREIVLTGINLGSYRDPQTSLDLTGLLRELLNITQERFDQGDVVRFRISSIEPKDVTEELLELMASSEGRICRHFHLPLQSGSSKVLSEMARPYDAAYFIDLVARARKLMPSLSLSTDIIVGFPGETEEDFQATLQVARDCAFSRIHAFPYSMREGTPAAQRADQIDPEIKKQRADILRKLGKGLALEDLSKRAGTQELALVEQPGILMTESYHRLAVSSCTAETGSLVPFVFSQVETMASE